MLVHLINYKCFKITEDHVHLFVCADYRRFYQAVSPQQGAVLVLPCPCTPSRADQARSPTARSFYPLARMCPPLHSYTSCKPQLKLRLAPLDVSVRIGNKEQKRLRLLAST